MRLMMFAAAIAVSAFASVSGVAQAAPVAPLPPAVTSEAGPGNVTLAYCGWRCRHWHRRHWCRWHRC